MKNVLIIFNELQTDKMFIFAQVLILMIHPCISMTLFSKINASLKETMKNVPPQNLTYDFIKPPHHLKGVKMERDGHLNTEFRKEVILGNIAQNGTEDEKLLISVHQK